MCMLTLRWGQGLNTEMEGRMCPVFLSGPISVLFTLRDIFSLLNQEDFTFHFLKVYYLMFSFNVLKSVIRFFIFGTHYSLQMFSSLLSHISK